MSFERDFTEKVSELISSVDATIPVDWEEVYISASLSETGGQAYFFSK